MFTVREAVTLNVYVKRGSQRPTVEELAKAMPQYEIVSMSFSDIVGDCTVYQVHAVRREMCTCLRPEGGSETR